MESNIKYEYFKKISNQFNKTYFDFLNLLIKQNKYKKEEMDLIIKAYNIADSLHSNQTRLSGEKYIIHPLNVAYLLCSYGFDYETLCAALLHDTLEDTKYTKEKLEKDFNTNIANLVDGVTKMKKTNFLDRNEINRLTHQKIMNSITKDARIIAIKLADRIHNMYTLEYKSKDRQIEIAHETYDFYVNLARILGIYEIKDELEDLSFYYMNKDLFLKYYDIRENIKINNLFDYNDIVNNIKNKYEKSFENNYKVKNVAGIYKKNEEGYKLEEIEDLVAIRLILSEVKDCYEMLELIKNMYSYKKDSIKDLIKNPKYNGYRSLNININNGLNSDFQVRMRTSKMQIKNELGMIYDWSLESQKYLNERCMDMLEANKKELKKRIK